MGPGWLVAVLAGSGWVAAAPRGSGWRPDRVVGRACRLVGRAGRLSRWRSGWLLVRPAVRLAGGWRQCGDRRPGGGLGLPFLVRLRGHALGWGFRVAGGWACGSPGRAVVGGRVVGPACRS
ncbi:hypothetical protein UO65_6104 [Actinokineospora spheciospongiae]|uniref:Uncharacterized protein n=1 Tax=Actinokineospora spheciospongiae TaxID=909613 RepID=W7IQ28_9PSEU|nr:hypothetical protein UO65_6104 [Actinokineospora spheciospongiae]